MHMASLREEEESSSSSAAKNGRLLRLEHILGGKSRRGVHRFSEGGTFPGESKPEEANTKSVNCVQEVIIDETMLEASTNSCISDNVHPDDLGLEIAMKQLMEATHDALVNMKGEILRMQYDLERALVEISLLQQREELLQQQFTGKAFELEKEFTKQIEDLRQTVILEVTMCKHESEQSILGKLELLLDKMRVFQTNDGKRDGLMGSSPDNKLALERIQESQERCHTSSHADLQAKRTDLQQSSVQRAALTQEALQRISSKRLEHSVAVVRGWLQSPTPSECSTAAPCERGKVRMCNVPVPIPTLVSSLKEEAKLFATTHRLPPPPPPPPLPPPPHHYSCNSLTPGDLPEVQPEPGRNIFKENAAEVAHAPHQRKEGFPQKTMRAKRPALRILKPKNFKISDLLVSDSDEELGL